MNLLDHLADRAGTVANVGIGVVFAATLAVEAHNIADYHGNRPFDLAVGTVICAAALLRRYSRAWAAAAAFGVTAGAAVATRLWPLPGQPGIAATLALLLLIGSAVRTLPARSAAAVAAGGAAVTFIAMDSHPAAAQVLGLGWGVALGTGLGLRLLGARRQAAVESVRRAERLELARELHDATAHHITGLVIQAQAARIAARRQAETFDRSLADIEAVRGDGRVPAHRHAEAGGHLDELGRSPAGVEPSGGAAGAARAKAEGLRRAGVLDLALADIELAGADALTAMRRVIGLLRDGDDGGGLSPGPESLTGLVERFAGRGPVVRLLLPDGPVDPGWPGEVSSTVNRVVGEALTNVLRHAAGAGEVRVTVGHGRGIVRVEVSDDAAASGTPRFLHSGGYGLVGMRERVEALGGTLAAGPRPEGGWSVVAILPTGGQAELPRRSSRGAGRS
jgi:signal transduction histidine kinase